MAVDPIDKLFLHAKTNTVLKVTGFEQDQIADSDETMEVMTVYDLGLKKSFACFFREDIGEDLIQLPDNFPQDKIDAYLEAAKQMRELTKIIEEFEGEILLR